MKLIDAKVNKKYEITNFGSMLSKDIMSFYEQGITEKEIITLNKCINVSNKIIMININNNIFSFKAEYAKEIEVKEIDE